MTRLRTVGLVAAALAGVAGAFVAFTLPPPSAALQPGIGRAQPATRTVVPGAYHVHTTRSDGTGTVDEVAAAAAQVAYDGTLDGSVIYGKLCQACHGTGAGGAPMLTKAAWTDRVGQGTETLIKHAIDGYTGAAGLMPARGGNPSLSDDQVKASVEWMLGQLK